MKLQFLAKIFENMQFWQLFLSLGPKNKENLQLSQLYWILLFFSFFFRSWVTAPLGWIPD